MTTNSKPPELPARGADPGDYYRRPWRLRGRRPARTPEALGRKYGMARARAPRRVAGTFTAPVDIGPRAFAALRLDRVRRFVAAMEGDGYRLCTDRPIRVETGAYPAHDLRDGPRDDLREYVVSAWFTVPDPKPLRIELPPWFTDHLAAVPERS